MSVHAFAKDSRACAACVSWGGERAMAPDNTLVHVTRYSVEGACLTAISQDYRKVTKAYHTCTAWQSLPLLRSHGGRSERTPGPSAAISALIASGASVPAAVAAPPSPKPQTEPEPDGRRTEPLDIDKVPPAARVLVAHWQRLKAQLKALPASWDLDTAQIREAVPRLALLVPVDGGRDFLYRACGRAIQRRLGTRPVMKTVSALHPEAAAERWLVDLKACLDGGEPVSLLVKGDPILPGSRFVEVLLPLADESGRPASVLAYRHLPGG
ncbi:hypothetical protein [Azospirillum sp. TSO22-1]|uniref:hypothetical protein n=1 Tax=Azospirillum sp. TSO22-1 TaxID=716789 RepID=UPI000D60F104|nr:hypothetical protein [Azospirillum sp. TSO22-1]PWC54528.1 hypothetical protein TSO221_07690 [Azospirillum sp. TSO22-1]